ncbi:MAG: transglutaminase-like cysteine peptidase, partial [Pseudomonadota bacterium]
GYNTEEFWTYPTNFGDCEDYVLMKRHMLMERGWPASSLLITVVRQPNGEGHAVLTVRTDRGDFILDNLETKVKPWNETPYTYLKRQAEDHSGRWIALKDFRA